MTDSLIKNWEKATEFLVELRIVKEANISPWACLTQTCHETGFFARVIGENNYWGIKKPRSWRGPVHKVLTHEFENGIKVAKVCEFVDWDTPKEALAFYIGLIQRLYPTATKC